MAAVKVRWVLAASAAILFVPPLLFPAPFVSAAAARVLGRPVPIAAAHWTGPLRLAFRDLELRDGQNALRADRGELVFGWPHWTLKFTGTLEIRELDRELIQASGDVRWLQRRPETAEIDLFFPANALAKLPEAWRERLEEREGMRHLRCEYRDGELTLSTARGPLLRASWEMVY